MIRKYQNSVCDAYELPKLIRLEENLYGASFFLMKLLPARFMLDRAREAGLINRGSLIIETTSGTFGLGLAIVCALNGYRLILVSDPVIDVHLKRRLEDLGAYVEIVKESSSVGSYQRARLDRMAKLQEQHPDNYWPSQYHNPHNAESYAPLAELLTESIGQINCLVGTVGSGGSMCGTSFYLRQIFPHMQAIGIDTQGSILFGQPDKKRALRGLGNSLMPKNLDHSTFDQVHWITAAEAFHATRLLHRTHGLYMGGTSGAAYLVAQRWAKLNPGANVVCLLPDEGYRYSDTIYCDEWLEENKLVLSNVPQDPVLVKHPLDVGPQWSYLDWGRRTYEEVVDQSVSSKATK